MRIGLQTWGTEGDVRPFIALAAGLSAAGHNVTLAVTEIRNGDYSEFGKRFGFRIVHPGHIDVEEEEFTSIGRRMVASGSPALKSRLLVSTFLNPVLEDMYLASRRLCSECDVVIGHLFAYPLKAAALKSGVPWVSMYTTPLIPSPQIAPPGFPEFAPVAGWKCFGAALDLLWKPDMNEFYREKGLKKPRSVFRDVFFSHHLNLVAVSPSLYPGGGVDGYCFCGAMEIPDSTGFQEIPDGLMEFLKQGDPPVYITFGSMLQGEQNRAGLVQLLEEAVAKAGCRAVLQVGDEAAATEKLFYLRRVAHNTVFPYCAAVVHHGGSGTTHTACASGVPSLVVEYTADQPLWGRLLKKAGVAPKMLHRRSLTAANLADAIREVISEPSYADRAEEVSSGMRSENGVAHSVELIEKKFGG